MAKMRSACVWGRLLVLVVALALPLAFAQLSESTGAGSGPTLGPGLDERYLKPLFPNDTVVEQLQMGRSINGTLQLADIELLAFSVPKLEPFGFPDILLSMDVPTVGGDADIFCRPFILSENSFIAPLPSNAVWQSVHTQGNDYVFISRNHTEFLKSVTTEEQEDGNVQEVGKLVCTVIGLSQQETDFKLSLDVDYESRTLEADEMEAIQAIADKCCAGDTGCFPWKALQTVVQGADGFDVTALGTVPVDMCHVPGSICGPDGRLRRLNMIGFGLDCEFPTKEFAAFKKLEKLQLSRNSLTGDIGDIAEALSGLKNLDEFAASGNQLSGSISDEQMCDLVSGSVANLNLETNQIEGPLPACLFNRVSNLVELHLDGNQLNSSFPDAFQRDAKLQVLSLVNVGLRGDIPQSMDELSSLRILDLRQNMLTGELPEDIGFSPYLTFVRLESNQLTGEVPSSLATSSTLRILALDNNLFSSLPKVWYRPEAGGENLKEVGLAHNNLSGEFPMALAMAPNLTILDLSKNNFSGPLPKNVGMFQKAWFINLSNNQFTGSIPEEWASIGLINGRALKGVNSFPVLDLSNNSLSGELPDFILNVEELPFTISAARSINLEGNNFPCPENASVIHLVGLEECIISNSVIAGGADDEGTEEEAVTNATNSDVAAGDGDEGAQAEAVGSGDNGAAAAATAGDGGSGAQGDAMNPATFGTSANVSQNRATQAPENANGTSVDEINKSAGKPQSPEDSSQALANDKSVADSETSGAGSTDEQVEEVEVQSDSEVDEPSDDSTGGKQVGGSDEVPLAGESDTPEEESNGGSGGVSSAAAAGIAIAIVAALAVTLAAAAFVVVRRRRARAVASTGANSEDNSTDLEIGRTTTGPLKYEKHHDVDAPPRSGGDESVGYAHRSQD